LSIMNRLYKNRQNLIENIPGHEKPKKPTYFYIAIITGVIIGLIGVFFCYFVITSLGNFTSDIKDDFSERFEEQQENNAVLRAGENEIEMLLYTARAILRKYDMTPYERETGSRYFEVSDYEKIEEINEENYIAFYYYIGVNEFEKILMAHGYADWDDFLVKNGHVDEKGEPQIHLWIYSEKVRLGRLAE